MAYNLQSFIHIKNCIDKDLCDEIHNSIEQFMWEKHAWSGYQNNSLQVTTRQNKELSVCYADERVNSILLGYVSKAIDDYISSCPYPFTINRISATRFNLYTVGTDMEKHVDHINTLFDGNFKGVPILSIVGVLNDNYKGGNFIFFEDYEVKLSKGDLMIFPSNFIYPHAVKEITEGNRLSFVSWAF